MTQELFILTLFTRVHTRVRIYIFGIEFNFWTPRLTFLVYYFINMFHEILTKICFLFRDISLTGVLRFAAQYFFFELSGKHFFKNTAWNTVISPYFLVQKFCGKAQFRQSFERFIQKLSYAEFRWNYGILLSGKRNDIIVLHLPRFSSLLEVFVLFCSNYS